MTHGRSSLLAIGALCLIIAACATPHIQPVTSVPDDVEFVARLDMLARAFESLRADKVLQFYAQDTYSVSFDLPYAFDPTAEDHFVTLERFFATVETIRLQPGGTAQVSRTDDRAWTTRSYSVNGTLKSGETFKVDGWHSAIWERRDGVWLIAYEHFGGPATKLATTALTPNPVPAPPPSAAGELRLRDVFFEYARWEIRPDGTLNLLANVELLKTHLSVEVAIEGTCDERGTDEYNLQLGQKRADAVREFLINAGIAPSRIRAVSLGKSRTFSRGQGEPAWGLNRRAHFVITKR